jgi:hypothetical protein
MPDFEDFGREISKIWPKKLFRTALSEVVRGSSTYYSVDRCIVDS